MQQRHRQNKQPSLAPPGKSRSLTRLCQAAVGTIGGLLLASLAFAETPPLASWTDTATKARIVEFVSAVTDPDHADYVPVEERIATFDNDGTLWSEQPAYFQLFFAIDQAITMIEADPTLAEHSPFREIAAGDMQSLAKIGEEGLLELVMGTHATMTETEFADQVRTWLATARHPSTGRPYTEMVYQPMLELLAYLRAHDFQLWISSGGGVSFLRVWAEDAYGIPPNQIIGSRIALTYRDGELHREGRLAHLNDKGAKPVGIQQQIGRRPILAVGNSDGDYPMLEWTSAGTGPSLGVLIHHTDGDREWAYDRDSSIGRLDRGLDDAEEMHWLIVDMQRDWSRIYPWSPATRPFSDPALTH